MAGLDIPFTVALAWFLAKMDAIDLAVRRLFRPSPPRAYRVAEVRRATEGASRSDAEPEQASLDVVTEDRRAA